MISVAQNCILQVRGSGFWQWQCWILQRVEKHRQLSCRASNICLCDVWMKRAPWVFKKQMFKLVRHNQPQACNFQKQPVAIPHLMGTEFQWQACFGLPSWLVYQFTSLSLKFSLSEDSFQFQVHSTVSKTRISGMRLLHKAHTHPAPADAHLWEPPHRNTFPQKVFSVLHPQHHTPDKPPHGNRASNISWLIHHCLSKRRNILMPSCWLTPSGTHYKWLESHLPMCKPESLFHL